LNSTWISRHSLSCLPAIFDGGSADASLPAILPLTLTFVSRSLPRCRCPLPHRHLSASKSNVHDDVHSIAYALLVWMN
jgi:hypothetical protein